MEAKEQPATDEADARPERVTAFKDYLRVFTYATTFDYVLMVPAVVASVGAGLTLPLMNVVFANLIQNFNDFFIPGSTNAESSFRQTLDRMALYLFSLFLARFFLAYINKFTFRIVGIRMSAAIRADYLRSLFSRSIHVLDTMPPGHAATTLTTTSNTLQLGISEKLGVLIEFTACLVAAIVIAFTYSWHLTLVAASSLLFISVALGIFHPLVVKQQARKEGAETKATAIASEVFAAIRMVVACGAEGRVAGAFAERVREARRHGLRSSPLHALQFGLLCFNVYGTFALTFWYGTKSYAEGRVDGVGEIFVVLMSVMILFSSMERISSPLIAIGKAQVAATAFFAVIDAPPPETGTLRAPDVTATGDLVFRDVTFAYPGRPSDMILDGLTLTIEGGKTTAIVGPSGAGKSTIVGLLVRWYSLHDQGAIARVKAKERKDAAASKKDGEAEGETEVEKVRSPVQLRGSISTGGHELNDIDIRWWRSQIGLVQQEPFLFNDTILNNVAYGLSGTDLEHKSEAKKRELVVEACREAFADEFISRLPDGYDTVVGESGAKLSGGQRQRIAIARCIISRPKILILDEATSSIDVHGERIVQAALERASHGRTTIVVAHRLSTIRKADRIVVLKSGRVAEHGTHASLLAKEGGVYSALVHAQQLAFGNESPADYLTGDGDATLKSQETWFDNPVDADSIAPTAQQPEQYSSSYSGITRLLYEQRRRWPAYLAVVIAGMVVGAAMPAQAYLFARIIVVFQSATSDVFVTESRFWSLMWLVLGVSVGAAYAALAFSAAQVEHRVGTYYKGEYFQSLVSQKMAYFDEEGHGAGVLTVRVLGDPRNLQDILGPQGAQAWVGVFNLIGGLAISFAYSWKLSFLSFFVVMPIGAFCGYYRLKYENFFAKLYEAVFAESSKWAAESITAIRTVSSLTLETTICQRYQLLLDRHVSEATKKARYSSLAVALSDSLSMACQALIFWVGGQWLVSGEVPILGFFVVFMAILAGAEGTGQLLSLGPNVAQAAVASNRIIHARETKIQDMQAADDVPQRDGKGETGIAIELRDVHFKYPTRNVWVLRGVSLRLEKGQFAALVGASGSGKTTLISLLERFYDVSSGEILFDGKDISNSSLASHRRIMSLVSQEPNLLQGTIRENILLGVPPSTVDDATIHAASTAANIHDFVVSLPEGYDTPIGPRGVTLSGGQKQRLAIARALVRDPDVLLLDEATSSLDSENEMLVQAALERAARGRTTIAVAHRLATIQRADVIYVMQSGRVVESGAHAELLTRKGVYWSMCQSQALDQ